MWIGFNSSGSIITQLVHGQQARQGSVGTFEIFCYFNNVDLTSFNTATISFENPDGTQVENVYVMDYVPRRKFEKLPSETTTGIFTNGTFYPGFKFIVSDAAVFSQYGNYKASVKLYSPDNAVLVEGRINFAVEEAIYTDDINLSQSEFDILIARISALEGGASMQTIGTGVETLASLINGISMSSYDKWFYAYSSDGKYYVSKNSESTVAIDLTHKTYSLYKYENNTWVLSSSAVMKDEDGYFTALEPTEDDHVATKEYVDNADFLRLDGTNAMTDVLDTGGNGVKLDTNGTLTGDSTFIYYNDLALAKDGAVVHKLSNETIYGIKTFASFPQITDSGSDINPTLDNQLVTKKYADTKQAKLTAGDGISISSSNVISCTRTSAVWGNITGSISNQTDLSNALNDIREVAEGKNKAIVIDNTLTYDTIKRNLLSVSTSKAYDADGNDITSDVKSDTSSYSNVINAITQTTTTYVEFSGSNYLVATISNGYVFYNSSDFDNGDIVLITQTDVPDRWYAQSLGRLYNLEATKVDLTNYATKDELEEKQDELVSGTNIKTINNQSVLGSGNISIDSGLPTDPTTDGSYYLDNTIEDGGSSKTWKALNFVKIINAPTSLSLTPEEAESIKEGVFVNGTFSGYKNPVFFPATYTNSSSDIGFFIGGNSTNAKFLTYSINKTTNVITLGPNPILSFDVNNKTLDINGLNSLNSKSFPSYPTDLTKDYALVQSKTTGELSWSTNVGGGTWGSITGTLSNQTDLNNELINIREVAAGKTSTLVLKYGLTIETLKDGISSLQYHVYKLDGTDITSDVEDGDYDNVELANSSLNSQDSNIGIHSDDYYIFGVWSSADANSIFFLDTGTNYKNKSRVGDNLLIEEVDVPDRWYNGHSSWEKLETTKIDLSAYQTKLTVNPSSTTATLTGLKIDNVSYKIDSGTSVSASSYSVSNTQIEGITIGNTTYKILKLGTNNDVSSIAIGDSSTTSNSTGSIAIGKLASSSANNSVSIGNSATSSASDSIAIGNTSINALANSVTFDGNSSSSTNTFHIYDANYLFFRKDYSKSNISSKSGYSSGYSLEERLNGLTKTDNSVIQLDYDQILKQTLSSNKTYTFRTAPTSTGSSLSAVPTYRLEISTTANITLTLPSGEYAFKTDDSTKATLNGNIISLAANKDYEIYIHNGKIKCWVW